MSQNAKDESAGDNIDISEAFQAVMDLVIALKAEPLTRYSPKCFEYQVDEQWYLAINGNTRNVEIESTDERMGFDLPPFECAVWYNGWLAGSFGVKDGIIAAGEGANEETLIKALRAAEQRAKDAVLKGT